MTQLWSGKTHTQDPQYDNVVRALEEGDFVIVRKVDVSAVVREFARNCPVPREATSSATGPYLMKPNGQPPKGNDAAIVV